MSYRPTDMRLWAGRIDSQESDSSFRWHQKVTALSDDNNEADGIALLGFSCDEGVSRNKGRSGAKDGPNAIRTALANTAWHQQRPVYDAGNIECIDTQLEKAQRALAHKIQTLLEQQLKPIVLGGGHEVAFASFQGIAQYLYPKYPAVEVGIINLDAHLDLRNPEPQANSGTPFRQISQYCKLHNKTFNYYCIGVNESANTQNLFDYAKAHNVKWRLDRHCKGTDLVTIRNDVRNYLKKLDYLYLTICLDVFSATAAPGVSAPSIMGLDPVIGLEIALMIAQEAKAIDLPIILFDIAECNPRLDVDNRTSKLAARLIFELSSYL